MDTVSKSTLAKSFGGGTHAKQLLAKPIVHFQVRIPKTALHIDLASSIEVEEDCILRRGPEPMCKGCQR